MLKKILVRAGVNRENTRYASETLGTGGAVSIGGAATGWYDCDKIRFRSGNVEKIGGWKRLSADTFLGVCRSLWNWVTLAGQNLIGVGTNEKFYIEMGGMYYDITPLRATTTLTDPFVTTAGSAVVVVTDVAGTGFLDGDYVEFSGASAVGGITLSGEYLITLLSPTTYSVTAASAASSTTTGGGTVTAKYQISTGPAVGVPLNGWGSGPWGYGPWGIGQPGTESMRVWSQSNFGEDLVFGPKGGGLYTWDATNGVTTRGVSVASLPGANDVPTLQNFILVSDVSRFVIVFGCNDYGASQIDPLLIRWSDQESMVDWTPAPTNQAGSIRLSHGSMLVTAIQSRQEILVFSDVAVYSMQYIGAPEVWATQLVGENISIASQNAVAVASGTVFWMGVDNFYKYDGRSQKMRCDLRQFIFSDLEQTQIAQVCCGTNEGFNEVWWFYPSSGSTVNDRYVIYNYLEDIWYYGALGRTAWIDSGLRKTPIAATYANNLVAHEDGVDDGTAAALAPITAYATTAEFDLDDGHNFMFIWRVLPDLTFRGSTAANPSATMYMLPLKSAGSGYTDPASVGGTNSAVVARQAVLPVEEFTGIIYTRLRGRQLAMKIESTGLGVTWQMGAPRLDARPDGRR